MCMYASSPSIRSSSSFPHTVVFCLFIYLFVFGNLTSDFGIQQKRFRLKRAIFKTNLRRNTRARTHTPTKGKKKYGGAHERANGWHIMASSIRIISFSVHEDYRFSYILKLFYGVVGSLLSTKKPWCRRRAMFAAIYTLYFVRCHNGGN